MAAHRYWRLVGLSTPGNGDLQLSEVQMCEEGVVVDTTATFTCTIAPSTGAVGDLRDDLTAAAVTWTYAQYSNSGFALVWDFGVSGGVTAPTLRIGAGASPSAFIRDCYLQYSDDGAYWAVYDAANFVTYPGAFTLTTDVVASGAGVDPYYSSVSFLLKADGVDGSTVFTDLSSDSASIAVYGGAKISALKNKYGGTSAYFDGTGDYALCTTATSPIGDADFAVETWAYFDSIATDYHIVSLVNPGDSAANFFIGNNAGAGDIRMCVRNDSGAINVDITSAAGLITTGGFFHIACTVEGTTARIFLNGTQVATGILTGARSSTFTNLYLSRFIAAGPRYFNGYLDDFRITKGLARYTSDFTPGEAITPTSGVSTGPLGILPVDSVASGLPVKSAAKLPSLWGPLTAFPNTSSAYSTWNPWVFLDAYFGGQGMVAGTVKEKAAPSNTPLHRRVLLIHERSGQPIRQTWSDQITGAYSFPGISMSEKYTVLAYDYTGTYRAVVADNQTPEWMP